MNIPYILFGKSILKAVKANEMRPSAFAGMEFAFLDHEGHEYYTWPDIGSMPPVRMKEIQAQMKMVDSGTSAAILEEVSSVIIEKCNEAIQATGKKKDELLAMIASLSRELVFRRTKIIPEDAYYALAAVCCARKDEDPSGLDRVIHQKKIDTFMGAARAGDPFFQASVCLTQLMGAAISTPAGFQELRRLWTLSRMRHESIIQAARQ